MASLGFPAIAFGLVLTVAWHLAILAAVVKVFQMKRELAEVKAILLHLERRGSQ